MMDHFEEKSGNKYLILDDVHGNKEIWRSLGRY